MASHSKRSTCPIKKHGSLNVLALAFRRIGDGILFHRISAGDIHIAYIAYVGGATLTLFVLYFRFSYTLAFGVVITAALLDIVCAAVQPCCSVLHIGDNVKDRGVLENHAAIGLDGKAGLCLHGKAHTEGVSLPLPAVYS